MHDDRAVETEATELLRTMIRNACVNDGSAASGQEVRTVDALEDYFAGSGLTCERYAPADGRTSLITRMFHGNDERVDVESLRLSTLLWEAVCRDFLG